MLLAACSADVAEDHEAPLHKSEFCEAAANFDLMAQEELDRDERKALLRDLAEAGPPSLRDDFDLLAASADRRGDPAAADAAGAQVGAYIEEHCPDVNLPGIWGSSS